MEGQFEIWDYLTMICVIILSSVPGLYQVYKARKIKSTVEFLVVNKQLNVATLILSTVASYLSAISLLGFPVDIYLYGLSFSLVSVSLLIATPVGSHLILPVFFKNEMQNIFEYLELRFCKSLRLIASIHNLIYMLISAAFIMYAPALALAQVTGLHIWTSVLTIGITAIFYTALGGIKAVVWADVTQCLVMIGVYIVIIIRGALLVGGFDVAWEKFKMGDRSTLIDWRADARYPIWTMALGFTVVNISTCSLIQIFNQRYLSNRTLKNAQITYIGGSIGLATLYMFLSIVGIIMYAYYQLCDPLLSGQISNRDQSVVIMAMEMLSFCKGLSGVYVAGVMCAALSSVTSYLNSMVVITLSDYIPRFSPNISEQNKMKLSALLVIFYGLLSIALVALVENMEGIYMAIIGVDALFGGPKLVVFVLGMLIPWINSKGAIAGFFCSMIFPHWAWIHSLINPSIASHKPLSISGCSNLTFTNFTTINVNTSFVENKADVLDFFYSASSVWYSTWSLISGFIVAAIVSRLTGYTKDNRVNPDLLFPFVRDRMYLNNSNNSEKEKSEVERPLVVLNEAIK